MDEIQEIPEHLSTIKPADFNISRKNGAKPCNQQFMKNTMYRKFECRTMEILNSFKK